MSGRILIFLGVLYCLLFAVQYLSDPLALSPQLDAKENLVLADQISTNSLPQEPYYRAMLYPAVQSLIHPVASRISIGLLFGLLCHLLNGWLVFLLSREFWNKPVSAIISSSVYLFNPVSLFFALQLMDITFACSLFLGGVLLSVRQKEKVSSVLLAGLLLGLSTLARPHFLPVVIFGPAVLSLWPGIRFRKMSLAWIPIVGLLLFQGFTNKQVSGDFRILPWQGSYNLWAANRTGANGLYFKQVMDVSGRNNNINPAKVESIELFQKAHPGKSKPFSITEMNAFWRNQFFGQLFEEPLELVKLVGYKAYAVTNSYEQYNNLTFSYHKARFPLLKFNPLNWGILFLAGLIALYLLQFQDRRKAIVMAALLILYLVTLLIYYASARFRLPAIPLFAILSGGLITIPNALNGRPIRQLVCLLIAVFGGIFTFSTFRGIDNPATHIQDELLLANANADLGRDADAAKLARSVLRSHPEKSEALRIFSISYFNLKLMNQPEHQLWGSWDDQRTIVVQTPPTDSVQDAVLGVFYWNWDQAQKARSLWRNIASHDHLPGASLAQACLRVTDPSRQKLTSEDDPLDQALHKILLETSTNTIIQ